MVSLTAALAAGIGKDVSNRFILRETVAMVPTGAPVVIPLFFQELGLEHRVLLGFAMEAHWRFPQPDLGPFDYLQLLAQIFRFLTDPEVLLHRSQLPEALRLALTIGKSFIQLPRYLGGGTIGLTRALPTLDVDDSVARILDALKTGRPGYAIEAIPLKVVKGGKTRWIRIGDADVSFGPLTLAARWCVTTEEEFVRRVLPEASADGKLPPAIAGGALGSLPTDEQGAVYEGGFIVLLMGAVDLGGLGFRAQFGLAVTAAGGFETGIRLSGGVADAFELSLNGRVLGDDGAGISGRIALTSRQRTLIDISGMIAVSKTKLATQVELRLTSRFAIAGTLEIGKRRVALAGEVSWPLDASGTQFRGRGQVAFTATGIRIGTEGDLFGSPCTLDIVIGGDPNRLFAATGSLQLPALSALFERQVRDGALEAKRTLDEAAEQVATALAELEGIDLNVNSLKAIIVTTCDRAKATANNQINKLPTAVYRTVTVNLGFRKVTQKVKVRGVNPRAEARRAAKTPLDRLAALRRAARSSDKEQLGPLIRRALQDAIASRTIKVRGRTVTILSSSQIKKLSEVRDNIESWITRLPARERGLTVAEQHLTEIETATTVALREIGDAIVGGVTGQVPRVESIAFSTALDTIDRANLDIAVTVRRGKRQTTCDVSLDFDHPERAGQALYQAFEGSLG